MNSKSLLLALFLLYGVSIHAVENALFYKVLNSSDSTLVGYLYGTIHLVPKNQFQANPVIDDALKSCKTLALEMDLNIPLKDQIQLIKEMVLPEGKTLKDYLSSEQFKEFDTYLADSIHIKKKKRNKYYRFQPFFIQSIIFKEYYGQVSSFEEYFSKLAGQNSIPVYGLETLDFQMSLVKQMGIEAQMDLISTDIISEYKILLDAYLKNDVQAIVELLESEMEEEFEKEFLIKRNTNWVPQIEELFKTGKPFVAVGAAHLIGENGVATLLLNNGYIVLPMSL